MKPILQNWLLPFLISGLVIGLTFNQLIDSFYEQEEWLGLGNIFLYGRDYLLLVFKQHNIFMIFLGEGRILTSIITYFFYSFFPFNSVPLLLFALSLHLVNTILVFYLLRILLKSSLPALFGSFFFSVNAVAQSTITWGVAISTLPATTFILLSLVAFLKSINFFIGTQIQYKWLTLSFMILYLSLLFKQIGIFLIPLYLITIMLYSLEKHRIKEIALSFSKKYFLPLGLFLTTILVYLIIYRSKNHPDVLFLTGSSDYFFQTLILRVIFYPLTSLSQLFIPPELFLNFARHVTNLYYPFFPPEQFILIVQTVVLDLLSVILSVLIMLSIYVLSKKLSNSDKNKIWFFVAFIVITFLPYVLISKSFSYFDSRYYYPGVIGASFMIAWIINTCSKFFVKMRWIISALVIALIMIHAFTIKLSIDKQASVSLERKNFLSQLTDIKPKLENNKNVFYITGDSDFYLPGHKVPFQNGMGHTLLVWYYHSGNVPRELIKARNMFELGSQGYFEYDDLGFGYFSDENLLKEAMNKYHLPSSAVISLYYNSRNKSLRIGEDLKINNEGAN